MDIAEQNIVLDDLLARWHGWCLTERVAHGYRPVSLGFDGYRTSRQYDDTNGSLDDTLDEQRMRAVNFAVSELSDERRIAICQEAKNLAAGREVFISPRLPKDRQTRQELIREARSFLARKLSNAGVI